MTSSFINANGIRFHYVEQGSGELLILLHGFPEFWYGWRKQIDALSKNYRVVALDMRGYNLSDKPASVSDYTIQTLAKDIQQIIFALGETQATIIGHDWGAAVAWAVASFHPEVVKKLVVINVPHPLEMSKAFMGFNMRQWLKSWYIFFFQLPWVPEKVVGSKDFFENTFKKMYVRNDVMKPEDLEQYVAVYTKPETRCATVAYYRAAFRQTFGKPVVYPKIKAPVLMLWGEQDVALGKELTYHTARYCENTCEIKYDPTSGHFVQHENPEWVNQHILQFLEN